MPSDPSPPPAGRRALGALFALPVLAGIGAAIRHAWVCDDIFITFRYVDQWVRGNGLVYNAGERVEGYTHFLWVVLLAALHRAGFDLVMLGRYLPIVAFGMTLAILFRRSLRAGAGWSAVPLAAWGLALHKDAQLFASSGLETAAFGLALLVGLLVATGERQRPGLAAWAYAVASLLRPEGVLYSAAAGAYVLWRWRDPRRAAAFAATWAVLFAPFIAWQRFYYQSWVPNTFHAKSAALAWWEQGWWYTRYYFGIYAVLVLCVAAAAAAWWVLGRRRDRPDTEWRRGGARSYDLALLGAVQVVLTVLYVTRVGGDFMFARFYIPITPIVYLLCEDALRRLERPRLLVAAAATVAALTLAARIPRDRIFVERTHVHCMTDEANYYPRAVIETERHRGEVLGRCLAGTTARVRLVSGSAIAAYFGRLEYAVEQSGLTDREIALLPLRRRGRPGHEKQPSQDFLARRHIQIQLLHGFSERLPVYARIRFGDVHAQILYWDPGLMRELASKPEVEFMDFPAYLDRYIDELGTEPHPRAFDDYTRFRRFYFLYNNDPERLQRLRGALAGAGIDVESMQYVEAPALCR